MVICVERSYVCIRDHFKHEHELITILVAFAAQLKRIFFGKMDEFSRFCVADTNEILINLQHSDWTSYTKYLICDTKCLNEFELGVLA